MLPSSAFSPTVFCGGEGGRRPDEGAFACRGTVAQTAGTDALPIWSRHRLLQRPPHPPSAPSPPEKARGEKALEAKESPVPKKDRSAGRGQPEFSTSDKRPMAAPNGRITITKPVTFTLEPRIVSARRNVPESTDKARKCLGPQTHSFLAASCANPPRMPVEITDLWSMVKGVRRSLSTRRRRRCRTGQAAATRQSNLRCGAAAMLLPLLPR